MFRSVFSVARAIRPFSIQYSNITRTIGICRPFSALNHQAYYNGCPTFSASNSLVHNKQILELSNNLAPISVRTVTKFSLRKGKRKTVKAAIKRFFRLDWGGWIRPKVARKKKLWTKSQARRRRLRQHVLTNATQSTLLDKMVTKFWKRPKHYVDDPYAPYHKREEFFITRKKPLVRD